MRYLVLALAFAWCGVASAQSPPSPAQSQRYCTDPRFRELDFAVGDWDLEWTNEAGAIERASSRVSRDEFGNCAIVERMEWPHGQYRQLAISAFDRHSGHWRQTFIDNEGAIVSLSGGRSADGDAAFALTADRPDDRGRQRRMVWTDVQPDSLVWRWERRANDGEPWVADWIVKYRRR